MFNRIMNYFRKDKSSFPNLLLCIGAKSKSKDSLLRLAYTDAMTRCYNRNALEEYREMFDKMELYVGVVDIDGLKQLNDIMGHDRGDELIKSVADDLRALDAIVIRLGGDEFLVLSVNHVLHSIKNASYGVVYKSKSTLLSQAMSQADKSMYYNKKKKR